VKAVWNSGIIKQMMGHGIMYKQGDILLIPIPFTD